MLPLAGHELPSSHAALADAITRGLAHYGLTTKAVRVEGGTFPAIEELEVDLTGARATRDLRVRSVGPAGAEGVSVSRVEVKAAPMYFETTPLRLELSASEARLGLARDDRDGAMLSLSRVAAGEVSVEAQHADLEALVHSMVASAASAQGVEIKSTRLQLSSNGPRSVDVRAEVTAKMFIMSAKVVVSGLIEIDDTLTARLSRLTCAGDGMVANAASALLKPRFAELERRKFPLLAFSLGEVKLRDVTVQTGETLRLRAEFGS